MKTVFDLLNKFIKVKEVNTQSLMRSIRITYFAQLLGLIGFLLVVLTLPNNHLSFIFTPQDPLFLSFIILTLLAIPIAFFYSKSVWDRISPEELLKGKMLKYQQGFTLRLAVCQGVGLYSVVCLLLSNSLIFLIGTTISIIFIISIYPSVPKIALSINLTQIEMDELENKNYH